MKNFHILLASALVLAFAAGGYAAFEVGMRRGASMAAPGTSAPTPSDATKEAAAPAPPGAVPQSIGEGEEATRRHIATGIQAGQTDPANGRRILYYHDPMVPGNKFDKPAKSPFMDMMLVPVYADGDADQGKVTVSSRVQQNLGVRTAVVSEGQLAPQVSAVGSIAFNERDHATVQARATGYVERLHVRATLDRVAKGQPLVELFVPEWVAAQEEFLSLHRMPGKDLAGLVDGARQRMRLVGMNDAQIALVERTGKTQARTTLFSPIAGVVTELSAREGMTVMAGAPLFRINGLSTVWANAEVPESQAALVRPGAMARAQSPAVPGVTFEGRIQTILPDVNASTRTLKARLELANPGQRLVPGMFVSMQFMDVLGERALLIPTEAVIQTGKRTVVLVAEDNGRFIPQEIQPGIEFGGQTEVKSGLQAGQRVVVSSQFLIDSEASLKGVEARLNEAPAPGASSAAPRHEGEAQIVAVDKDSILLSHGPIPSIQWGPMTMEFKPPPPNALPRHLEKGDHVTIEFFMDKDGMPQLTRISPMPALATAPGAKK
ncbi:efflux RND transporter periplasmic adaptor subunit [Acidovorax sp.]|uniref:efflux RND transporter periplasmic adaptor subunit n=1 Tax=Acidovorax sp. TaxID=1872122 RepID=UPI002ACED3F8|nr:efflux RND transporter periplasmic adaptor subunit [Acidovorax sp.]MDZ7863970.1 efflux RND transporter periplasmic adaptor subunit [Acidovorax sp.]